VVTEEKHFQQMHKSQCRNIRKVKKQGNVTPPKVHNSSKQLNPKKLKWVKIPDTEFKCLFLKM
jgi:hypothetical protein